MSAEQPMSPEAAAELAHALHTQRVGLRAVASTSLLSFITTVSLFIYVAFLFFFVRPRVKHGDVDDGTVNVRAWKFLSTQSGRYFLCLVTADLMVAVGVATNWHWLSQNPVKMEGAACTFQAVMIQVGIVADAIWNPVIAVHIMLGLVYQKHFPEWSVYVVIGSVWGVVAILSLIGPVALQTDSKGPFYDQGGAWCWISAKYQNIQFWLHYLFVFAGAIIDIICYSMIFFYLRGHARQFNTVMAQRSVQAYPLQHPNPPPSALVRTESDFPSGRMTSEKDPSYAFNGAAEAQNGNWRTTFSTKPPVVHQGRQQASAVEKTAKKMLFFPPAYMILTLPLATFRAGELLGRDWDQNILIAFGAIFALGGLVDTSLFWFTRNLGTGLSFTKLGFSRATGDSGDKSSKGRFSAYRWGHNNQQGTSMGQVTARIQVETRVETMEDDVDAFGVKRYHGGEKGDMGKAGEAAPSGVYSPRLAGIQETGHFSDY